MHFGPEDDAGVSSQHTNTQSPAPGVAAEALKDLLDGIHAGRFVPLANSEGYCQSLVDNAEEALTALQASAAAVPVGDLLIEGGRFNGFGYRQESNLPDGEYMVYAAPPLPAQVQAAEVTEADIDRALNVAIPGGSTAEAWFLPHEHEKGDANVRDVVRRMLASRTPAPGMAGGVGADEGEGVPLVPIATVYRGGVTAFGKATCFRDWLPGSEQLPDGEHTLFAAIEAGRAGS